MKIGINTLFIVPNQVGGTEYHTRSFLKYLEQNDFKNEYIVFCNKENYKTFEFKSKKWKKVLCNINAKNKIVRILYEQVVLPFKIVRKRINIFHSFGYFGPIFTPKVKKVLTVHDANWLDHPNDTSRVINLVLKFLMKHSILTSDIITTSSEFSKKRILKYFPSIKIKVLLPGIDEVFKESIKKEKQPIYSNYALCVSAFYPHKNVDYLIKIWNKMREDNELKLIIVGKNGADSEVIRKEASKNKNITILEKVSIKELTNLYKFAKVFLLPSIYEGFGFPVYEALYAKREVIVGKKEIFDKSIQGDLSVFDFKIESDIKKIIKLSKKQNNKKFKFENDYNSSSKELISIYHSLSS